MVKRTFSTPTLAALTNASIIGIRAGTGGHRFIGIWVVVVDRRVFVRPWNNKPTGWYRGFLEERRGAVTIGEREIPVRARMVRGERLIAGVDRAYAAKYSTPASRKYVRGFTRTRRRMTTVELMPR